MSEKSVCNQKPPFHEKQVFRVNNFDLIRLFAALQVALHHTLLHLELQDHWLFHSTSWLPGVPIFFFVSGFLISRSYEGNSRLSEYARNRALRIYPALVLCTAVALASVFATGYLMNQSWPLWQFVAWILGQVTIVQFYNPEFMRAFGSGVLNGSLWTITVELQFYVLIPLVYWALGRLSQTRWKRNAILIAATCLFVLANVVYERFHQSHPDAFQVKLAQVTFVPWLYMFLLGVIAQQNFAMIHRLVAARAPLFVGGYTLIAYSAVRFLDWQTGNEINPLLFPLLALAILSLAYSAPTITDRLLHKNDISYGVYVYHMPVVNLMIFYGLLARFEYVWIALACTIVAAILSWTLVERIAIRKKKRPLIDMSDSRFVQSSS